MMMMVMVTMMMDGDGDHRQCSQSSSPSQCYNYRIPFRYQMPANVKKRAITAGLIGRNIQQWLFIGKKLWKRTNSIFFCYRLFFLAQEQNPIKSFSHLGNRRPRPLWGKAWNVFVLLGDTFTLSEDPIKLFHKT